MSELPSKYSSRGLSVADQGRVITTGVPRRNRPIGAIKIEERVNVIVDREHTDFDLKKYDNEDTDGDIPMFGMDDEDEVRVIADYVQERRQTGRARQSTDTEDLESIDIELTPEPKPSRDSILVLDTNFMISHLDIVDKLAKLHTRYHHTIVIPTTVVKELDGLKGSKKTANDVIDGTTVGHLARWANDWIYRKLADSHSSVRGQKIREVLDRNAVKDDAILDCCLYFKQKENSLVILLSNDKNLCMKALTDEVLTVSYRKDMTADTIARKVFEENQSIQPRYNKPLLEIASPVKRPVQTSQSQTLELDFDPIDIGEIRQPSITPQFKFETQDIPKLEAPSLQHFQRQIEKQVQKPPQTQKTSQTQNAPNNLHVQVQDFRSATELIFSEVQKIVLGAVDYCMYQEYEDDLDMVGYEKSKIVSIRDSANTIIRFWISVFTEYFQNSAQKPFNTRGRKEPRFVRVPYTEAELHDFITYWSDVLRALYSKRDDTQNKALENLIERWKGIAKPF